MNLIFAHKYNSCLLYKKMYIYIDTYIIIIIGYIYHGGGE